MKTNHQYTAYFCGCFIAKIEVDASVLTKEGWSLEDVSIIQTDKFRHIYYEEFLNFCAAQSSKEGCVAWQKELNEEVPCEDFQGEQKGYMIPSLHCYLLPFNIVIFSIEVTMETTVLDDIKLVASNLREFLFPQSVKDSLLKLNELFTGQRKEKVREILEFGYRLKYFQVICSDVDMDSMTALERKRDLYQLSTMERETSEWKTSFCNGYIESAVKEHALSVFNNWDALSLLDTFTIRAFQSVPLQDAFWRIQVYRMIYIQSLFQKYYLQHLNQRFRATISCKKSYNLDALLSERQQYERLFQFHKIAYTFLPLLVDEAIDKGLEIKEEEALLSSHIEREHDRHQAQNERVVSRLLMVISGLAAFSAIWDISCLVNEIFPYVRFLGSARRGYFGVSSLIFLVLLLILIIVFYRMRRKKY